MCIHLESSPPGRSRRKPNLRRPRERREDPSRPQKVERRAEAQAPARGCSCSASLGAQRRGQRGQSCSGVRDCRDGICSQMPGPIRLLPQLITLLFARSCVAKCLHRYSHPYLIPLPILPPPLVLCVWPQVPPWTLLVCCVCCTTHSCASKCGMVHTLFGMPSRACVSISNKAQQCQTKFE